MVTFVPTYDKEFNSAKTIANKFSSKVNAEFESLLSKDEQTKPQAQSQKREASKNLGGLISVKSNLTDRVVLVSDVFTTGASARECTKALKKAGADQVWIFTLARGV